MAGADDEVGVPDVGARERVDEVVAAIETAGCRPRVGAPADLPDAALAAVVAPGESALRAVAVRGPDAPILPVDADPGVRTVGRGDLAAAVEALRAGPDATERHPILRAAVDGESVGRLFRDLTLVTAEPARISEFEIDADATGPVDAVRADGVVVATPAGSHGYAAAGSGPLLAPGTGLALVPVAPFRTDRSHWVVPERGVSVQIRRDEAAVTVEADGEPLHTVGEDATVTVRTVDAVEIAVVEESTPTFR